MAGVAGCSAPAPSTGTGRLGPPRSRRRGVAARSASPLPRHVVAPGTQRSLLLRMDLGLRPGALPRDAQVAPRLAEDEIRRHRSHRSRGGRVPTRLRSGASCAAVGCSRRLRSRPERVARSVTGLSVMRRLGHGVHGHGVSGTPSGGAESGAWRSSTTSPYRANGESREVRTLQSGGRVRWVRLGPSLQSASELPGHADQRTRLDECRSLRSGGRPMPVASNDLRQP